MSNIKLLPASTGVIETFYLPQLEPRPGDKFVRHMNNPGWSSCLCFLPMVGDYLYFLEVDKESSLIINVIGWFG